MPPKQYLLTLDNVHGQTTNTFKAYIKMECNSLVWLYPGRRTDARRPIGAGLGAFIKVEVEVGQQFDLWLENGENLERWESNDVIASDRRVLLTKWVATAVDTVENHPGYRFRLCEKTGSMMTSDGTSHEEINLEGLTEPLEFLGDASEDEAAGAGWGGAGDQHREE